MKRPGIILLNLLIMLAYSTLFMMIGGLMGDQVIALHWGTLLVHIVALLIWGLVEAVGHGIAGKAGRMLLSALVVALIGHGLCFFNGLLHMGNLH